MIDEIRKGFNAKVKIFETNLKSPDITAQRTANKLRLDAQAIVVSGDIPQFPKMSFKYEEADLVLVGSGDLAHTLLKPLVRSWLERKKWHIENSEEDENESLYIMALGRMASQKSSDGKLRFLIMPASAPEFQGKSLFQEVLNGTVSLYLTGRKPSKNEEESFNKNSPERTFDNNDKIASIIARDALTLYPGDRYTATGITKQQLLATPKVFSQDQTSEGEAIASQGLALDASHGDIILENPFLSLAEPAKLHSNAIILSAYHTTEGTQKMRFLKLANREGSLLIFPSKETIRSEEYAYTYRIQAWRLPSPAPKAPLLKELIEHSREVEQQKQIVAQNGFVPLEFHSPREQLTSANFDVDLDRIIAVLPPSFNYHKGDAELLGIATRCPIFFRTNGIQLKLDAAYDHALPVLKKAIGKAIVEEYQSAYGGKFILIVTGHADADGENTESGRKHNWEFSEDRAGTFIQQNLLNNDFVFNLPPKAVGCGVSQLGDNNTEDGKQKNRRVDFFFIWPKEIQRNIP